MTDKPLTATEIERRTKEVMTPFFKLRDETLRELIRKLQEVIDWNDDE